MYAVSLPCHGGIGFSLGDHHIAVATGSVDNEKIPAFVMTAYSLISDKTCTAAIKDTPAG